MRFRLSCLLLALLVAVAAGCGDDCGSISRFTDENGLTVLVVCGQVIEDPPSTATRSPTATPTPRP